MKKFNLDEYLKNPTKKVVTRDGSPVRILCTDRKGDYSIIALVENCDSTGESLYTYTKDGYCGYASSDKDNLFFAPKKHEGWINIFDNTYPGSMIFDTKEVAEGQGMLFAGYVTTIKIEWEE